MKNRKNISKVAALGATIALTAAACGSDDPEVTVEDEPVVTDAMEDDAMEDDAMEDDAMEDDAMEDDAMEDDAMEDDAMEDDAMEDDAMEDDAMEDDAMEDDAMEDDAMEDDAMEDDAMEDGAALAPTGPLCDAVPADGEGSFEGMTDDPAGTAASNNPALSTLVAAVTAADLVDTLNSDGPFTIFAPANPAFEAFSAEELDALLADTATLTSVLTLHVVEGQLSSTDLAGMDSVTTVNGADITIAPEGDTLSINGQATVGCADVSTANATVHIIDAVLMPAAGDAMEEDAMEEDAMEEDAMEEDAMEEDAMEEDAMEEDADE